MAKAFCILYFQIFILFTIFALNKITHWGVMNKDKQPTIYDKRN